MPPKAKITRDMIIDAAFTVVRRSGASNLNVRRVAAEIGCSTQPVMYHFDTVDKLRNEIYQCTANFHQEYLLNCDLDSKDVLKEVGMRYIRFAGEENKLFRFIFQYGKIAATDLDAFIEREEFAPFLDATKKRFGYDDEKTVKVFELYFNAIHGYASLIANEIVVFEESKAAEVVDAAIKMMG